MKKLYEKNELLFALLWIALYCAVSVPIRGSCGDESVWMLAALACMAAGLLLFIRIQRLGAYYGLVKWRGQAKSYLYFLPVLLLTTGNLWGGAAPVYEGASQLFAVLSMLLVGVIEELVFRGLLFRALLKQNAAPAAITISAVTFGIGHIVNLLAGQGGLESLVQICFAVAWGFLFTMLFYKSGSLLVCIPVHGLVDVFSKYAVDSGGAWETAYIAATIILSAAYCLYLRKRPTALTPDGR